MRIYKNYTLEQYKKKYRKFSHRLLKIKENEVKTFDKKHASFNYKDENYTVCKNDYLLKNHNWYLINGTYYQKPSIGSFVWFRNLKTSVQVATCAVLGGGVVTAITVPILTRHDTLFNVTLDAKKVGYFEDGSQTKTLSIKKDALLKDAINDIKPSSYLDGEFNKYTFDGAGNKDINDFKVTSDITIYAQYKYNSEPDSVFLYSNKDDSSKSGLSVKLKYEGTLAKVDWGDGSVSNDESETEHIYADKGTYKITVSGETSSIRFTTESTSTEKTSLLEEGNKYIVGFTLSKNVTSIPQEAFANMSNLSEAYIADDTGTIGNNAFSSCTSLEAAIIPNGVTSIGDSAFENCNALTYVVIGNNVKEIGDEAFSSLPNLENIVVSSSNETYTSRDEKTKEEVNSIIKKGASGEGDTLLFGSSNTVIPDSVKTIADNALVNNNKLESIEIPSSVTSIGTNNFTGCDALTELKVDPDNKTYTSQTTSGEETNAIMKKEGDDRELVVAVDGDKIPDEVTIIKPYACKGKDMYEFHWPAKLKKIGKEAFYNCSWLPSIELPASVVSIGYSDVEGEEDDPTSVFLGCNGITSISVAGDNENFTSLDANVLVNKTTVEIIRGCVNTDFTKLDACTAIDNFAFEGTLQSIAGPSVDIDLSKSNIKTIGDGAFAFCININSFAFPKGVTSIGSDAFQACLKLTNVTMPETTDYTIGDRAFSRCMFLQGVNLNNATSIGKEAFSSTYRMQEVDFGSRLTFIGEKAFEYCGSWLRSLENPLIIKFADPESGVELNLGEKVFQDCFYLKEIAFPSSFTSTGQKMFENCYNLEVCDLSKVNRLVTNNSTWLPLPAGTGAYHAFQNCSNIKTVYVYDETMRQAYANDTAGWGSYGSGLFKVKQ